MRYELSCLALLPLLMASAAEAGAQTALIKTAFLEGTVVNAVTGEPIAGARVKLQTPMRDDEPIYSKTNEQGRFQFAGLTPGKYWIVAGRAGFMREGDSPTGGGQSDEIDLTTLESRVAYRRSLKVEKSVDDAGTLHASVTIHLTPYAVLTGKVTNPEGLPLAGVQISLFQKAPVEKDPQRRAIPYVLPGGKDQLIPMPLQLTSDDRGEYRVARLAPGDYYVAAGRSTNSDYIWDRAYRTTYYPRTTEFAEAKPLRFAAGQQAQIDLQVVRQTGVRLSGRVSMPARGSMPPGGFRNTSVYLKPRRNKPPNSNRMTAMVEKDQFQLLDVVPGEYTLTAVMHEHAAGDPYGTPVFGVERTVNVAGGDIGGLDLDLHPLAEIQATVTFEEGCTPEEISIQASGDFSFTPRFLLGAGERRFVLPRQALGHVWMQVQPRNFAEPPGFTRLSSIRVGGRDVQQSGFDAPLAEGETLNVIMTCNKSGGVR